MTTPPVSALIGSTTVIVGAVNDFNAADKSRDQQRQCVEFDAGGSRLTRRSGAAVV